MKNNLDTVKKFLIHNREILIFVLIISLASFLRLYQLDQKSLWVDEIGQAWYARIGPIAALKGARHHVAAMPLDYLVMFIVTRFGSSDFVIRLPSALWGILSVIAIYFLALKIYNLKIIALISAFLLAISPFQIYYSQEARFYSLFTFLTILTSLIFINAIKTDKKIFWYSLTILLMLSFYTHLYTLFLVLSMWIFLGINILFEFRAQRISRFESIAILKKMLITTSIALFSLVPWMIFAGLGVSSQFQFTFPSMKDLFIVPIMGYGYLHEYLGYLVLPILAGFGSTVGVKNKNCQQIFPFITLIVSVILIISADYMFSYFFNPRQILFVIPFYILLISCGIWLVGDELSNWIHKLTPHKSIIRSVISICLLLVVSIGVNSRIIYYFETNKSANWREISKMIHSNLTINSHIIFSSENPYLSKYLSYYQPTVQEYIKDEAFLNSIQLSDRAWIIASNEDIKRIIDDYSINAIPLQSDKYDKYILYYGGLAQKNILINEISAMEMPVAILANSNILFSINTVDPEAAIALINRSLNQFPLTYPPALPVDASKYKSNIARIFFIAGEIDEAEKFTLESLRIRTPDLTVLNNAGYIFVQLKECEKAIKELTMSNHYFSNQYASHYNLGRAYECNQEWQHAVDEYIKANEIKITPASLFRLAVIYEKLGKPDEAIQILNQLLLEFPENRFIEQTNDLLQKLSQ